ncbi:hypothetical protein QE152_g23401 [Popillia japonica]|uniref:Uncharacterized protein n=1 Tax=Popillia japonica TaxID=7064 RepID=A0AAW1KJ00_POPJA
MCFKNFMSNTAIYLWKQAVYIHMYIHMYHIKSQQAATTCKSKKCWLALTRPTSLESSTGHPQDYENV